MAEQREPQVESLQHAVDHILEEARMLLPGIQALFGFQLIAVFNQVFHERLSWGERALHLAAVTCVALSTALVIAPAAYHRQAEPHTVSAEFVRHATLLLRASLPPLLVGMALDAYLIARLALGRADVALALAVALALFYAWFWFACPWRVRRADRARRRRNQAG